jgi:DNA repair exonuclease SbcCD ATPase subunit
MKKIEEMNKEVSFEQIKGYLNVLWNGIEPMIELKALNTSIVESMEELKSNKTELETALGNLKNDKEELLNQLEEQEIKFRNLYNELLNIKSSLNSFGKIKDETVSYIKDFSVPSIKELINNFKDLQHKFNFKEEKVQVKEGGQLNEYML